MHAPIPVIFEPIFKPRPWGGLRLRDRLGKAISGGSVGEAWEIADISADVSRVAAGPLAGCTVNQLIDGWGTRLLGGAQTIDGRFPLLIKWLDAAENLSVQVHPRESALSTASARMTVKDEAWVVIEAAPGAMLYAGAKPGTTLGDFTAAAGSPRVVELLNKWPVRAGECFYLPSGVPHALGAGVLVAEVQTPSDTTFRLFDWNRVDGAGRPRDLHIDQALANVRLDIAKETIAQPRSHIGGALCTVSRLMRCDRFGIDRVRFSAGFAQPMPHAELAIWLCTLGDGVLRADDYELPFHTGDTILIPAESTRVQAVFARDCEVLEVTIPIRSPLTGLPHPPPEPPGQRGGPVPLGRPRSADPA